MKFWFASILVKYPHVILISVIVFCGTCLFLPFTLKTLPNFSDPQMGFETRGTTLSNRLTAWKNLIEATRFSGPLSVNPKELSILKPTLPSHMKPKRKNGSIRKKRRKCYGEVITETGQIILNKQQNGVQNETDCDTRKTKLLRGKKPDPYADILAAFNLHLYSGDSSSTDFFCGPPDESYVHIVIKSNADNDLFTLNSLLLMCQIEHEFMQANVYEDLCVTSVKRTKRCCRPWSLGNYVALLNDRVSCLAITEEDVSFTKEILNRCSYYFRNLLLTPDCHGNDHCQVPPECKKNNGVYNIFNYITSVAYSNPNTTLNQSLTETVIFFPLACSSATLPYYHNIESIKLQFDQLSVVAMEFGLKNILFDEYLIRDTWLMGSGSLFVLICIWLYTKSLFLTLMTILAILFSLGISYFMYTLVLELRFFPFMNLLAIVVAIGIGADDTFIFCKVWNSNKKDDKAFVNIMNDTIHHAFFSMFVTSITTAAALFASYLSSITAVRCFSLFASMAVLANCLLMMSWFPASVIIWERICSLKGDLHNNCISTWCTKWSCTRTWKIRVAKCKLMCARVDNLWHHKDRYLLESIISFRHAWFAILTTLSILSGYAVFYYPKLLLPDSSELQLLVSSHPFEKYDLIYKDNFWFKRSEKINGESVLSKFPLRFVWGVKPVDNGNYLDPRSIGTLELDKTFDMSHPKSQKWLLNFCRAVRKQPFYQSTLGPLLPNCFIESFESWMQRKCQDPIDNIDRSPCCESEIFPYNASVFNLCIVDAIADLYQTPSEFFMPGMAGPKFSKENKHSVIKAVVVEYDSKYSYSMSFDYVNQFIMQVELFMREQLKYAPKTMRGGWFVTDVQFYDLQKVLIDSSFIAIIVSMGFSFFVLLIATCNVITSLYAIFSITCSIVTTIGVLVLLGWKLNILESIAISTAIGLTVDFSLHYTVNYKLCPSDLSKDRQKAARFAVGSMLEPSFTAALTTGMAGVFMLFSSILPYIQIGILLVTVMTISWIYATFHLGSMLAMMGPERNCCRHLFTNLVPCLGNETTAETSSCKESSSDNVECPESESVSSTKSIRCSTYYSKFIFCFNRQSSTKRNSCKAISSDQAECHELQSLTHKRNIKSTTKSSRKYSSARKHKRIIRSTDQSPASSLKSFGGSRKSRNNVRFADQSPATSSITIIVTEVD